jgi:hypothetical protein
LEAFVFPDSTLKWRPFPSILDGIKAPPFVQDRGVWRGVLNLIVLESPPGTRAYSVEIRCDIYGAYEEMIYSIAQHGDRNSAYNGHVYIKEAESSSVIEALANMHPLKHGARQFLFVGADFCYETIGFEEPTVRAFASKEEAYSWMPGYGENPFAIVS